MPRSARWCARPTTPTGRPTKPASKLTLALAIIAVGLAGRSAVDKVLALRGGGELVALWAQLSSVMEMVSGVALTGIGAGLSVLVAQTGEATRQRLLFWRALRLGLAVGLPIALAAVVSGSILSSALSPWMLSLAALCGWIAIAHGMVNSYWLGQERRGLMLALSAGAAAVALVAAVAAPSARILELLAVSQALPVLVMLFVARSQAAPRADDRALERYLLPGLAIGILSPLSLIAARGCVADALSWHEAGVLQALWRIAEWIAGVAAGVLSVLYLPRLAAAQGGPDFGAAIRSAVKVVLVPSAILYLALFALHRPLLVLLYDASFEVPALTAAVVFAGSVLRIAAWIPLFALYAMRRTRAIAVGELLSLPLFALLLGLAGERLTLEVAGMLWFFAYACFAAFNFWAMRRA